jgi:hypothetical protein
MTQHPPRLGHYPEFHAFFVRTFALDRAGCPNRVSSARLRGRPMRWCLSGGAAEPFPSGLEVYAIVEALKPLDDALVDKDL